MTYYNKYTAKKHWKDLKPHKTVQRNKNRYVQAPNPGRSFEHAVPFYGFLKKTLSKELKLLRSQVLKGYYKVNGSIVKDLKHPLVYGDYVTMEDSTYMVKLTKPKNTYEYHLVKTDLLYYNVKNWLIKDNQILVITFQNKNFKMEKTEENFAILRSYDGGIVYDDSGIPRLIRLGEVFPLELIKLTGRDKYSCYKIKTIEFKDRAYDLELESESGLSKRVVLSKTQFKIKYLVQRDHHAI